MSSTGGVVVVGSGGPKPYFCYQCERTVSISLSPSSPDLLCPLCKGGFLEEFENPNPNPNPFSSPHPTSSSDPFSMAPFGLAGFPLVFSSSSGGFDLHPPAYSDLSLRRSPDPDSFNPLLFLQNYLHTLMAGGANIQFVIENSSDPSSGGGAASFRLPANFGDYFLGPGLEQLIQQLAENDPNRYGTPPAAKSAVDSLPDIRVSDQILASDSAQCAVCMDAFELGAPAKQMPCKHIFHPDCILPWLARHNSCPVCRYELPTDDPDYEHRARGGSPPPPAHSATNSSFSTSAAAAAGTGQGDSGTIAERRFRISLPWPFRAFGSPAGASGSGHGECPGSADRDREGNSNSNSGSQERNRDSSPDTRQEDLD